MKHVENANTEKDGQDRVMWRYCFTREKYQIIYKSAVGLWHFYVTLGAHYLNCKYFIFNSFSFEDYD